MSVINGNLKPRIGTRRVNEKLAKARTFDEICAPFAQAVAATGISDEELESVFEEARVEAWQEKQGKKP
jgi:hypothetical protein